VLSGDDDDAGWAAMNATLFALAFLAALNPRLFGVDLLLAESRRPRLMFLCFLLGGLSLCLAVGLLDVFLLPAGRCHQHSCLCQRSARPGPRSAAACHRRAAGDRPPAQPPAGNRPGT
jgi:hypothetical protein